MPPELVDPPNATLEKDSNEVDEPHEGDTYEDKNDSENNTDHILLLKAKANAVDHPYDCDCGDAENKLDYLRKIINSLDKGIHIQYLFLKN